MSSIVVQGDTSGSVILEAPAVAGTVTVTLPATSGTMAVSGASQSFTDVAATGNLTVDGNTILGNASTDTLNVGNGGLVKDASGNVGIGTSSPSYRLEVVSPAGDNITSLFRTGDATSANNAGGGFRNISSATATSRASQIWLDADGANFSGGDYFYISKAGNSGNVDLIQQSASAMTFQTSGSERMRIDSSGNLLVGGQTGSITPYALLQVRGDNKGISIQDTTDNSYRAIYNQSGSLYFYNGSNEGYLSTAGAWINASDAKLKNSIVDIKHGLSSVLNTKPRSYKMNGLDGDYIGFVAQELQPVIPEVVSQSDKQLGVDYGSLVAVAFKAIQEQQAIIQTLNDRITALENK